jgi:beta-glucuronidase
MLRPRDTATRQRLTLDGVWRFAVDTETAGPRGRWYASRLPGHEDMALPASFNDVAADADVRDHVGDVWY